MRNDRELAINPQFKAMLDGELVWLCSHETNPEFSIQQECELTVRDIKDAIRKKELKERNN